MKSARVTIRILATLGVLAAAGASGQKPPTNGHKPAVTIAGTWKNPKGTVAVKTGACADKLCGWVSWASPKAIDDARRKGVDKLIGTALLRDYRPDGDRTWSGEVYVPDMGRSFSSTIRLIDADTIKVKGCLIGGFICKSQIWRRVEA